MEEKKINWKIIEPRAMPMAHWILSHCENVSNLKLQKLLFYCYGCALAFDFDEEVEGYKFEAWKYGPVEKNVYRQYSKYESQFLPKPKGNPKAVFSSGLDRKLNTIIRIYGGLTPMELVRQSHFESPWLNSWNKENSEIPSIAIKNHFTKKFVTSQITYPEVILDSGIFEIDSIPVQKFKTIEELANALDVEENL